MSRLAVLALCALGPLSRAQTWTALEPPSLSRPRPERRDPPPLLGGSHLLLPGAPETSPAAAPALLPAATLRRMLEEEIRARGLDAELQSVGGLLAARGSAEAVAALGQRVAELDRAGRARTVRVTATTTDPEGGQRVESIELASGETGLLGGRERQAFVYGYDVEVAHDSGVADPIVATLATGRTLHVSVWRARSGRGALVAGFLDVAEEAGSEAFDPGTPELGQIDRPELRSVQVAFSGWVESGGELIVELAGTGVAGADGRLALRVETTSDEVPPQGWRARDLALLESPSPPLPLPRAGVAADLDLDAENPRQEDPRLGALDLLRSAAARVSSSSEWPRLEALPGLIAGPADDPLWPEIDALADAAEASRLVTRTLSFEAGDLRASFPVAAGRDARLAVTSERTWIVDYDVSLAPETWMAAPVVVPARDGLVVQGRLSQDAFAARGWRAGTRGARELRREDSTLGAMQLPDRWLRTGRWSLAGPAQLFEPEAGLPAVRADLR